MKAKKKIHFSPFETAAEWVRHMNCQHTEIELAIFNSKKDKEQKL